MKDLIEKRRGIIINVIYYALLLAAFYLLFKYLFGLLFPFIAAFLVAALLHRPVKYITGKTPLNRSVTSTVFVLLILGAVGILLFLAGNGIVGKVREFYQFITLKMKDMPAFFEEIKAWSVSTLGFLPEKLRLKATESVTLFFDDLIANGFKNFSISGLGIDWSSILAKGGGVLKNTVAQIPSVLIAMVISVVACVFITIDYDHIKAFVLRQFSDRNRKKLVDARDLAVKTLGGMLKAYTLIILITTTELCIGFYILKLLKIFLSDYIVIISFIIAIVDIIPVLGTGTVLIPWSIYSFISGDFGMGVGLLVMYVVILIIRQVIEPKLVAGQAGLSPIVTIIAMYVGTKTLGVLGFFILPFCVILINKFNEAGIIHLFKLPPKETPAADGDAPPAGTEAPEEPEEAEAPVCIEQNDL